VPSLNRAVLALGSNLGDRSLNLQNALDALVESEVLTEVTTSSIYETDPVGGPEQGPYLNAVIQGFTQLEPFELLAAVQRIEDQLGRIRSVRWGPRTVDIDILAYGQLAMNSGTLTIPHPRAFERAFVLIPWCDVDAEYVLEGFGTVRECLSGLSPEGVHLYADAQLDVKRGRNL